MQSESGQPKKIDISDILIVIGAGLVFYGAFRIYQPAAFVLLGIGLVYFALQLEKKK